MAGKLYLEGAWISFNPSIIKMPSPSKIKTKTTVNAAPLRLPTSAVINKEYIVWE